MMQLWNITIDDYMEIVKRAQAGGLKPGESMQKYFIEYMNEKGKKPSGVTELTKDELLNEMASHNQNVLQQNVDKEGHATYKIAKGRTDDSR